MAGNEASRRSLARFFAPPLGMLLLIAAVLLSTAVVLVRQATHAPDVSMLVDGQGAQWIAFPKRFERSPLKRIAMAAEFRRDVQLERRPKTARLLVQTHRAGIVEINDQTVAALGKFVSDDAGDEPSAEAAPSSETWKQVREFDVATLLRAGENSLRVRVESALGPPALWLRLEVDGQPITSDGQWQVSLVGSSWRSAVAAGDLFRRTVEQQPDRSVLPRAADAATSLWPFYAGMAVVLVIVALGAKPLFASRLASASWAPRPETAAFWTAGGAITVYAVLVTHNTPWLYASAGFDALEHLKYIQYVMDERSLPLAPEGWEMYHPPLYYMTAAALLSVFGLSTSDAAGLALIRCLGVSAAGATLLFIAATLKRLFPKSWVAQVAGVVVAASLPGLVAIMHYPTNELLCAAFAAAAFWLFAGGSISEPLSTREHVALGVCLGAALLSKASGLVPAGVVLGLLAGRLVIRRDWRATAWIASPGVVMVTMLAVCGWQYARVWYHLGSPLALNVDTAFPYWQDPGIQTPSGYVPSGRVLGDPYFAGAFGLVDGILATGLGDGNLGGAPVPARPPWNYGPMAIGYWLAIVPLLIVGLGLVVGLVEFVYKPRQGWFGVWGVTFAMLSTATYGGMFAPWFSATKGTYLLSAFIGFAALGGLGAEWLRTRMGKWSLPLWIIGGLWTLNTLASFWIVGGAETHVRVGQALALRQRDFQQAAQRFQKALTVEPDDAEAQLGLASLLLNAGQVERAVRRYASALEANPASARAHWEFAVLMFQQGNHKLARHHAEKATRLPLDHWSDTKPHVGALALLGQIASLADEDLESALGYYRDALCYEPQNVGIQLAVARLYLKRGDHEAAEDHFRFALRLEPKNVGAMLGVAEVLHERGKTTKAIKLMRGARKVEPQHARAAAWLAWLLATSPELGPLHVDEALTAAELALAKRREDVFFLDASAAALANAGRFDEALATLRHALSLAEDDPGLIDELRQRLELYEAGVPYRAAKSAVAPMPND